MRSHILAKSANRIFSAYNGIFKIAYAENTPHMLKFAYIAQISAYVIAFFSILSDVWPHCLIKQ